MKRYGLEHDARMCIRESCDLFDNMVGVIGIIFSDLHFSVEYVEKDK